MTPTTAPAAILAALGFTEAPWGDRTAAVKDIEGDAAVAYRVAVLDADLGGAPGPETTRFLAFIPPVGTGGLMLTFASGDVRDVVALATGYENTVWRNVHNADIGRERGFLAPNHNRVINAFADPDYGDWNGHAIGPRAFYLANPERHYGARYTAWRDAFAERVLAHTAVPALAR